MNGKKVITAILAAVLAAGCVSCGKTQETTTNGVQTVTIWTGESHSKDFITEQVDNFNKTTGKENGVKIEYIVKPDIGQVLDVAIVSDQAPDMFGGGPAMKQLISNNNISALEDIEGGSDYVKSYDPQYLMEGVHKYEGKTYTVPYAATTDALVYNKDMFVKAGIVDENGEALPPKTLQELREDAKKLTNAANQEYGIAFPAKWAGWYGLDINEVASVSSGFINAYNPATGKYDLSAVADIMKIYMGIKEDGSYLPGAEGIDNDPARAKFATGKIGMKFAGSFDYAVYTDQFPATCKWGVAPIPVLEGYDRHKAFCDRSGYLYINSKAKEKVSEDKLMLVYKFMTGNDMLKEAYKAGKTIPYDYDIVKDIKLSGELENWESFAALTEISFTQSQCAKVDINGKRNIVDTWNQDVWPGKIPVSQIDSIVKECEDIYNAGIQTYVDAHPEYNLKDDIDPDFNTKQ